jgi:phage repressor protein C with HTH and peptisase S24 domain
MENHDQVDFDYEGFSQRLAEAIFPEKPTAFAMRAGVPQPTVSKYLKSGGTSPRLDIAAHLAKSAGVTLDWLVTGKGDGADVTDIARVPRYDVTLAAGHGRWNEGRKRLDDIPFTGEFLRKKLNRSSAAGLAVLEARGDSMYPTISDSALVLIDELQQRMIDGIFAFVLDGDARVKRFRRTIAGVTLISDNPAYPPEDIDTSQLNKLQIIGQVLWVSQVL